jgi:hypothetical protein
MKIKVGSNRLRKELVKLRDIHILYSTPNDVSIIN